MIKKEKVHKKKPLFALTNRFVLFLFGFSLVLFSVYLGGNWQNFLDSNQLMLLTILTGSAFFLFCFILIGLISAIVYSFKYKTMYYVKYIVLYFFYALIAVALFVFSIFVNFIAH